VLFKALLLLVLVGGALFAWRARNQYASLAVAAAAFAGVAALFLHNPLLVALGVGAAGGLAYYASRHTR
jgi:hypothetical protein